MCMQKRKRLFAAILTVVLLLAPLAQANAMRPLTRLLKTTPAPQKTYEPDPTFGFWINPKDCLYYARWERKSGGVSFSVKMQNDGCDTVDAFTLEITAKDVYEEPVLLKSSDGCYEDALWYTIEQDYKADKSGYSKYILVQGDSRIKYISATLVKYHSEGGGTFEVAQSKRRACEWTIK